MSREPTPVNIRNFSVKCGRCGEYQVLASFEPDEESNRYIYECEWPPCSNEEHRSRTIVEVPVDLDEFANRDPNWRGGKIHGGAEARQEAAETADEPANVPSKGLLPVLGGE